MLDEYIIRNDVNGLVQEEETYTKPEQAYAEAVARFTHFTICKLVPVSSYAKKVTTTFEKVFDADIPTLL